MRLGEILSNSIFGEFEFEQVEPFMSNKNYCVGKEYVAENIGTIARIYFCKKCNLSISFNPNNHKIRFSFINERMISIHMVLRCSEKKCKSAIPIWFIIESEKSLLLTNNPKVRLLFALEKPNTNVVYHQKEYGIYTKFLQKAELAFRSELGAAAIIYLRKTFEGLAYQVAEARKINIKKKNGELQPFSEILKKVDDECSIIPTEFSENGYKLFRELSNIIHGGSMENEEIALKKYPALKRLTIGILDNIKNKSELLQAIRSLNWNSKGEQNE